MVEPHTPFRYPQCARCGIDPSKRLCMNEQGRSPDYCPTKNCASTIQKALEEMEDPVVLNFARQAAIQERDGYAVMGNGRPYRWPVKPRLQETIEFAQKMNYRRLGLVFCIGLRKEARAVESLLVDAGFEVVSGLCKMGRIDKSVMNLDGNHLKNKSNGPPMCNPIAQAFVLNEAGTEFNIAMGLCVGHDSLFLKYADAMCTVLAAKDRVLGHNPLAAVYTLDSYYRGLK